MYYIEAQANQRSRKAEENFLGISLWLHKSHYHNWQTWRVQDEVQQIQMKYGRNLETQRITLSGMDPASEIKFTQSGKVARTAFSTLDATNKTADWKTNFDSMLTDQCTYSNLQHFQAQTFDDGKALDGMGVWQSDHYPCFCGQKCMARQTRIFNNGHTRRYIDALKYKHICFAVKGLAYRGRVQILYRY